MRFAVKTAVVSAISLIALIPSFVGTSPVYAAANPTVTLNEAYAYRNIVTTGDLFFVGVYDLPFQSGTSTPATPEEWCVYLTDTTGCTSASGPTNPTSLRDDVMTLRVYTTCNADCSVATLAKSVKVRRIGASLEGVWISAGHGITWELGSLRVCMEPSTTVFAPVTRSCLGPTWSPASDTISAQRTRLGDDLTQSVLPTLEERRNVPENSYTLGNKITTGGRTLVLEALPNLDELLGPSYFQAASQRAILTPIATAATSSTLALQTALDATATAVAATGEFGGFDDTGDRLFSMSGGAMLTVLFLGIGITSFVVIEKRTNSTMTPIALMALVVSVLVGMWVRGPTVATVFSTAFFLGVLAIFWVYSKLHR